MKNKKINVVLVHNYHSPYRLSLFKKLTNLNMYDFDILVCKKKASYTKYWKLDNKKQRNITILRGISFSVKSKKIILNLGLINKLLKGKYDVFIGGDQTLISTHITFIVAKLLKKPFILWSGEIPKFIFPKSLTRKLIDPFINFMQNRSEAFIVYFTEAKEFLCSQGVPSEKILIAPNTIDVSYIQTRSKQCKNDVKLIKRSLAICEKKVVLFVGRLEPLKRVDILIKAFNKLKRNTNIDVVLLILGSGTIRRDLEDLCLKLNIKNVFFLGTVERSKVICYYTLCNVFVLPGQGGIVVNEAMACEKPIIATKEAGGIENLVINGLNGFIVTKNDVNSLYIALKRILINPKFEKEMGKSSLKIILENFTINNMVEGFTKAINFSIARALGARVQIIKYKTEIND